MPGKSKHCFCVVNKVLYKDHTVLPSIINSEMKIWAIVLITSSVKIKYTSWVPFDHIITVYAIGRR